MRYWNKTLLTSLISVSVVMPVMAATNFTVKQIEITGNHRISDGTILNYLPIHVGDKVSSDDTAKIIQALYKTNFFTNVALEKQGNTLIVKVTERPTIGDITLKGNELISKKDLKKALAGLGVSVGQVYDQSVIEGVKDSLEKEYFDQGNYGATVNTTVEKESGNRVGLHINIHEGKPAKIREIKIIGNKAYSEKDLLKQFKLTTPKAWDFFTKSDQYSKQKLDGDIETLKSYYMDRGYIQFKVDSTQVVLSPDKENVDIVIHITEGPQYKLKNYNFEGNLIYSESKLKKLVTIKPGEIFNRKEVTNTTKILGTYYGQYGYAFAKITPIPHIDMKNQEVSMTFLIDPGKKIYVRRITFEGNTKTQDQVLRREMRQQEGALVDTADIKESERRLNMLGYFKGVKVDTVPVPGSDDKVDLDVKVKEAPSATLTLGAGYSDTDGFLINAGYNQPNFLGTGKNLGINFNTSDFERYYSVNYFNPYYTNSMGRGFNVYAQTVDTDAHDIDISTYATDSYGASMSYSMPLSETNNLSFGYGYEITKVKLGDDPSEELINFMNGTNTLPLPPGTTAERDSETFNNVTLNGGWNQINYDRGIFPTKGYAQSVGLELDLPGGGSNPQSFYKLSYLAHLYQPIGKGFIITARGETGFGDGLGSTDALPFYENYYAGGIGVQGAVRGYEGYSIGPKDSNDDTYGGNFLVDGTIGLIVPTPIAPDSFRTTLFVDFGNVYNTTDIQTTTDSGPMRFSAGIAAEWRSPIGPLVLSLAEPLNPQHGDDKEVLQFTVGTSF
ncbi:MAG: outer membrane protein assembly factor BamA [Legionellales bacterium]|nr:outer membrane protein assembly factor BamA [Legionellales bacterium]